MSHGAYQHPARKPSAAVAAQQPNLAVERQGGIPKYLLTFQDFGRFFLPAKAVGRTPYVIAEQIKASPQSYYLAAAAAAERQTVSLLRPRNAVRRVPYVGVFPVFVFAADDPAFALIDEGMIEKRFGRFDSVATVSQCRKSLALYTELFQVKNSTLPSKWPRPYIAPLKKT